MINGIRIIYPSGLNKGFSSKFWVGSRVRHETPAKAEGHVGRKNEDEDNSPNILSDKTISVYSYLSIYQIGDYLVSAGTVSNLKSPCKTKQISSYG